MQPPSSTPPVSSNSNHGGKDAFVNDPTPSRVVVPHTTHEKNPLRRVDLDSALQYGTAQGYPALYAFIRDFALTRLHPNIPYKGGAEVILTCGNTDGFAKAIECFTNPWIPTPSQPNPPIEEREGLLCEEFAYMGAIGTARPRGLNIVPVTIDAEGMVAYGVKGCLSDVLENWDVKTGGGKRPHMLYTVTMGQNPTSGLLSVKRRKEIYEICHKFDVIIVEDDPYFYIQFPHAANDHTMKHRDGQVLSENHLYESGRNYQESLVIKRTDSRTGHSYVTNGKSSGSDFLDSLVPSYLSIDVDGRVIRLDTFSKTIAPGSRLGWITTQPNVVERIQRITETTTQQPSGFVQSLVAEMLLGPDREDAKDKRTGGGKEKAAVGWKMDGWIRWLEGLRGNYERRMKIMSETIEAGKYITTTSALNVDSPSKSTRRRTIAANTPPTPRQIKTHVDDNDDFELLSRTQIYDFNPPMAGMFLWVRVDYTTHPVYSALPSPQLAHGHWIHQTLPGYRVLTAPGTIFAPTDAIREDKAWSYYRLCFAAIDEELVRTASEAFVRSCHDFWTMSKEDIEKILQDDETGGIGIKTDRETFMRLEQAKWTVSPLMC